MQRMLPPSRLSLHLLAVRSRQPLIVRYITTGKATLHDARDRKPSATEIKKTVPELWVRKMKTLYSFYDTDDDGVLTDKDYRMFEDHFVTTAHATNISSEKIERFKTQLRNLWFEQIAGEAEYQLTENRFIENMFDAVSRSGAEAQFRAVARDIFEMFDANGDGKITKEEDRVMRGGDPFSIVAFSAVDINRDGEITQDEYEQAYCDFFLNFTDETNPSKHLMGPLVK